MNRKTVFLLLMLTGVIPFACCPETPSGPYKTELYQVNPIKSSYMWPGVLLGSKYTLAPGEVYTGDTLLLELNFYSLLAHQPASLSFHASAMATSCDENPGFTHLQDKIVGVDVYSDKPYLAIPAGEPLTDQVLVYRYRKRQLLPLAQAIADMNSLQFYDGMEMGLGNLVLAKKPAAPEERTFTVRISYESGQKQTVTSIPVNW